MNRSSTLQARHRGFTIVELLIVIVVIAILAAITIVAYNGITRQTKEASLKSDVQNGFKQLQNTKTTSGNHPANTSGLKKNANVTFQYSADNTAQTFCLIATSSDLPGVSYFTTQEGTVRSGTCPIGATDGTAMQTITTDTCPTARIRAVDARDNHTYWVQKLADGRCWMLTNLAYAGGGTNTHGDVKTITNNTGNAPSSTTASYYIPTGTTTFTTEPTAPSTSTTGSGQHGFGYNWCAAMGGQTGTAACTDNATPLPNAAVSICPAGWRLPTGLSTTSEFTTLSVAINGASASVNSGETNGSNGLRQTWLAMYGGYYAVNRFYDQDFYGFYWSSNQSSDAARAHNFYFQSGYSNPSNTSPKNNGMHVRCIAV